MNLISLFVKILQKILLVYLAFKIKFPALDKHVQSIPTSW